MNTRKQKRRDGLKMKSNLIKWIDRILISVPILILVCVVIFVGWVVVTVNTETPQEAKDVVEESEVATPVEEKITVDVVAGTNEHVFQQTLHEMTHQKISADDKWGATQITDELIDEMLATLKSEDFENEAFYLEVLTAWDNGKFFNSVAAHNEIWALQGGSIGRATRLLTPQEEQEYIEDNFE